jgi:hypothetical protein
MEAMGEWPQGTPVQSVTRDGDGIIARRDRGTNRAPYLTNLDHCRNHASKVCFFAQEDPDEAILSFALET